MNNENRENIIDALVNGMSPEEVRYLFNDILKKSNTRTGKRVLRLFSNGIGKAKRNTKIINNENNNTIDMPNNQISENNLSKQYVLKNGVDKY